MSIRMMSKIWEKSTDLRSDRLVVMLALADWANDEGYCFPTMDMIANKTHMTKRGVRKIIKWLSENGYLTRETGNGRGHRSNYIIHPVPIKEERETLNTDAKGERYSPFIKGEQEEQRGNGETQRGNEEVIKGERRDMLHIGTRACRHRLSLEPSLEPSHRRARAKNAQSDFSSETMASENSESSSVILSDSVSEPDYQPSQALEPPKQTWRDIRDDARAQKLADICGVDTNWGTPKQLWDVAHAFPALKAMGITVEGLNDFMDWWHRYDWRGKRGDLPRPQQVREMWRRFERFKLDAMQQPQFDKFQRNNKINEQGAEYERLNSPDRNIRNEARIEAAIREWIV